MTELLPGSPAAFRPNDAVAYLRTRGWSQADTVPNRYTLWVKKNPAGEEFEALVPSQLSAPDLGRRVAELLETVRTEERRPLEDVWEDMSLPSCDVVRLRLLANEPGATLPLEDGAEAFRHTKDIFTASSCAAREPRAAYGPKKAAEVLDVVRNARLGQTRPGSYIIKLISPASLPGGRTLSLTDDEVSPSRKTVMTLAGGLAAALDGVRTAAATGTIDGMKDRVANGVSANFCDALAGLTRIGRGVEFQFSWAPAFAPPPAAATRIDVPSDAADYLQKCAAWFRRTEPLAEAEFEGYIHRLDRVDDDTDTVTMVGVIDGRAVSVRIGVTGTDRELATAAFKERRAVACTGDLFKEGKQYSMKNVSRLRSVDDAS